jgi:hypothetical protein
VAEEEPVANIAARLDKALERWDGNFWRTVIVLALTGIPGILLMRLPAAVIMRRPGAEADAVAKFDATIVGAAVHAGFTVLVMVIGASAVAWCYTSAKLYRVKRDPLGGAHDVTEPAAKN